MNKRKWIKEILMVGDEYLLKICVICHPDNLLTPSLRSYGSGKSDPSARSPLGSFFSRIQIKSTTGVDIYPKQITVGTHNIKLLLVDISTNPVFNPNYQSFFRGTSAAVFVFSKGNHDFLKTVIGHYHELRRLILDVPVVFIGLQDESEVVSQTEGQTYAQELGADYFEMAVDDLQALDTVLKSLSRKIMALKTSS